MQGGFKAHPGTGDFAVMSPRTVLEPGYYVQLQRCPFNNA